MIQIGRTNELQVAERSPHGLILTDGTDRVLLPNRYVPPQARLGEKLSVFVSTDSEDRPVATTLRPLGEVGDFAAVRVKDVSGPGAFVDWGLDKDLLVPFAEQRVPLRAGQTVLVFILLDARTNRVIGSTRLQRHLSGEPRGFLDGQRVQGIVADVSAEGARVIVDGRAMGIVFPDELHAKLKIGDRRTMFVKRVREDGALALALSAAGYTAAQELGPSILERLRREGGFLPLSDHSTPEEIRAAFGVSKATFKKAIGTLQKERAITIEYHGIRLNASPPPSTRRR
jgi:predicted RNA-binding protein (virulence factor B family)